MIKAIIFDLDGVLADTEQMHIDAFNEAARRILPVHLHELVDNIFHDGRTTKQKLECLSSVGNIDAKTIQEIDSLKQSLVISKLENIKPDADKIFLLWELSKQYKLALASNSRKQNVDAVLSSMKIDKFFDVILTSEFISSPKPDPEIFIECMKMLGVTPEETLIFEDSPAGLCAAIASSARTVRVYDSKEVYLERILNEINRAEN